MSVGIAYWDRDTWSKYFEDDVVPLYTSSLSLYTLWKTLVDISDGKFLSEVIKDRPEVEYIYVGGTSPPDKYEEDGLAYMYNRLLGTSIKLREYYFLIELKREPRTLCNVSRTDIVVYLDHISTLLGRAINRACELELILESKLHEAKSRAEEASEKVLLKPETLPELFSGFLNKAINFTVAYNECTRFIWHLRKITKKYITEFYPKLQDPEIFGMVRDILGLKEYAIPEVEDPEIADMYTIFSYDYAVKLRVTKTPSYYVDGCDEVGEYLRGKLEEWSNIPACYTIGGCVSRCNELIWGLFEHRGLLELVVREAPDPRRDWIKMADEMIVGKEPRIFGRITSDLNSYEALSIIDEYLPYVFTGRRELIVSEDGVWVFGRW